MKPNSVSLDQRFYRLFNQPTNKKLLKTVPFLLVLKNSISNLLFLRSLTFGRLFFKRNNSDILDEIWISVFLMDLASEKKVVTVKTYNTNKNITLIWAMFKQVLPCCSPIIKWYYVFLSIVRAVTRSKNTGGRLVLLCKVGHYWVMTTKPLEVRLTIWHFFVKTYGLFYISLVVPCWLSLSQFKNV